MTKFAFELNGHTELVTAGDTFTCTRTNAHFWTVGKEYPLINLNGTWRIQDNDGDPRSSGANTSLTTFKLTVKTSTEQTMQKQANQYTPAHISKMVESATASTTEPTAQRGDVFTCVSTDYSSWWTVGKEYTAVYCPTLERSGLIDDDGDVRYTSSTSAKFTANSELNNWENVTFRDLTVTQSYAMFKALVGGADIKHVKSSCKIGSNYDDNIEGFFKFLNTRDFSGKFELVKKPAFVSAAQLKLEELETQQRALADEMAALRKTL